MNESIRKPLWLGLPSNSEKKTIRLRRSDTYPTLKNEKCKNIKIGEINLNLNKLKLKNKNQNTKNILKLKKKTIENEKNKDRKLMNI